jgi:hypothetical protein
LGAGAFLAGAAAFLFTTTGAGAAFFAGALAAGAGGVAAFLAGAAALLFPPFALVAGPDDLLRALLIAFWFYVLVVRLVRLSLTIEL